MAAGRITDYFAEFPAVNPISRETVGGKMPDMALSARNQLPGIVEEVELGTITARVVVKVGNHLVESVITRASAEELALKKGDHVHVVIKSTEVMIQKD
jgi:molybdopterin-binding protein